MMELWRELLLNGKPVPDGLPHYRFAEPMSSGSHCRPGDFSVALRDFVVKNLFDYFLREWIKINRDFLRTCFGTNYRIFLKTFCWWCIERWGFS